MWAVNPTSGDGKAIAISFPIQLAAPLPAHFILPNGDEVFETAGEFFEQPSSVCTGKATQPTAAAGNVCVYAEELEGVPEEHEHLTEVNGIGIAPASPVGAFIHFFGSSETGHGYGSFAVTAE
jgi:hypothetical protein